MKKYLSFILSAALSLSAVASTAVFAEGTEPAAPAVDNMVVLGDSIARGYGLGEEEYSYAQLCADYLGCNLDNFAADGLDSSELLASLQNINESQKQAIENSEVVVVSIGGNDMMHYGIRQALEFAAKKDLLVEGYTADDIPEDAGVYAFNTMIDKKAFKEYADSGIQATLELNTELKAFSMNLRLTEGNNAYGKNQGIIKNTIMTNIDESVKAIRAINPDAQIIVQTVYNPFQLSPEYIEKTYGKNSGYATMLSTLREDINDVMVTFKEELSTIEDIEVVDVLQTFAAVEDINDTSDANPGSTYYFTDMQEPVDAGNGEKTMDFHPNKKGHLAIATELINKIKVKDTETGELVTPAPAEREVDPETGEKVPTLITQTVDSIDDIADCPSTVIQQIVEKAPDIKVLNLGDVDGNGFVNADDATAILVEYANISTGEPETFDEETKERANVDKNNFIDADDATAVLSYYAYLSTLQEGETPVYMFEYMKQMQSEE